MAFSIPIPQDIINDIIGTLSPHDTTTLKQCSLVSYSFLIPCQEKLFSAIYLKSWGARTCQRLYALLVASKHIAAYIRELYIADKGPTPTSRVTDKGWVPEEQTLPRLLRLLKASSGLRAFSLVFKPFTQVEWALLPLELRFSILNLCRSPNLTSLRLVGMWGDKFPIDFFRSLKHLKRLGFGMCSRVNQTHNYTPLVPASDPLPNGYNYAVKKGQLESLEFGGHMSRRILESLVDPTSLVGISRLRTVSIHGDSWVTLNAFLRGLPDVAEKVESFMWFDPRFAISTISEYYKSEAPFNLEVLPNLRSVCFCISAIESGSAELKWIVRSLANGSIPSSIEQLSIIIQSIKPQNGLMCPPSVSNIYNFLCRSGLDSALVHGERRYLNLRRVNIFVDPCEGTDDETEILRVLVPRTFPLLAEKDMFFAALCDKDEVLAKISAWLPAH